MSYTSKQTAQESHAAEQQSARPTAQLFSDQRLSTSVQLKQQQMMNTVQCMSTEEEEPLQGKFATAQLAEEEELLQGKFATTQRAAMEEEEPVQGKFETLQRAGAEEEEPLQGKFTSTAPTQLEQKPNNTGLPDNLKSGIENMSGYSMDDVKVHYNSDKPAQLNAHAYAQGTDIHVAPGQEQHLPHEAWHVVQQKQGRVQPTMQMKAGVPVNDDAGLEHEADVMGAKAKHAAVSQLRCDKCDEENQQVQLKAVIQKYEDCEESNHTTTFQHRWVQNKYISHFGGMKEFSFRYGAGGPWNFVDIVENEEIYEIKPEGGLTAARQEVREYRDKLNEDGYGCEDYDYVLGTAFTGRFRETGLGRRLTAWSPEDGVILYRDEQI